MQTEAQHIETGSFAVERRRYPRTTLKERVEATVQFGENPPIVAIVHDLSRGGIGLIMPQPRETNSKFTVQIRSGRAQPKLFCRVANCREEKNGGFTIGAAFVEVQRQLSTQPVVICGNSFETSLSDDEVKIVREMESRLLKMRDGE